MRERSDNYRDDFGRDYFDGILSEDDYLDENRKECKNRGEKMR